MIVPPEGVPLDEARAKNGTAQMNIAKPEMNLCARIGNLLSILRQLLLPYF